MANQWYIKSIEDKAATLLDNALTQPVIREFDADTEIVAPCCVVGARAGGCFENNGYLWMAVLKVTGVYYKPDDESASAADAFFYDIYKTIRAWTKSSFSGISNATVNGLVFGEVEYDNDDRMYRQTWNITVHLTTS